MFVLIMGVLWPAWPLQATPPTATATQLTFGILPIGGPSESLELWRPLLDDMGRAQKRPVRSISVSTYEGLAQAMAEKRVDIAFVSGLLALQAVEHDHMQVIAQLTRVDGSRGYHAVLLVAKDSPIHQLGDLFRQPGHWRYARGETLSVSGYLVPEAQLFAKRGLDSDTFFASVTVGNHQNNALAVANDEADVASNNTADLERFAKLFPDQYARLRILWESSLIPHAVIVMRSDLPVKLRRLLTDFITGYGKGRGASEERANLNQIHDISGFAPAGNDALLPFAEIGYNLDRQHALDTQWVNAKAMHARLQKIEADHKQLLKQLQPLPPPMPLSRDSRPP